MSKHEIEYTDDQQDLFDEESTRTLLDQLLADSKLYRRSSDYRDLLDFVVRLREFAPFNAMLLQVQKPGLRYAASKKDWWLRFRRKPEEGARPLLILWPFGPVALVYDEMDTEGEPLPKDVSSFVAQGNIGQEELLSLQALLARRGITVSWVDAGDRSAGFIRVIRRPASEKGETDYRININKNHEPAVQFNTLTHELGHLFLGHLGLDIRLKIPRGRRLDDSKREIEAESVAYIVCLRNGVEPRSHPYLSNFVRSDTTLEDIDVYQVMRAAGQVETILNLAARSRFDKPSRSTSI